MLSKVGKAIFGDPNERALKPLRKIADEIEAMADEIEALSDAQLQAKTATFRDRLANGETLDDLLVEAYAVVREVAWRIVGMRHFYVQLIGGIALHQGKIAEMRTGEGKTLSATSPLYLNGLTQDGAHLVTPNDYLSKVGLQQMGPIYHFLGLTAAVIQNKGQSADKHSFIYDPDYHSDDDRYEKLRPVSRREAYAADITYGTNNEFGFDYLRDNMVYNAQQMVQRGFTFAIVDEIDNILIDEARTPLIISGTASQASNLYEYFAKVVKPLQPSSEESVEFEEPDGDYVLDVKDRIVFLTEAGVEKVEKQMRRDGQLQGEELYSPENGDAIPYLDNSLRAKVLYENDKEYVVQDGQVIIVDEFTGRMMYGRRFSEGLHQAIEAKEGVKVRNENVTMATITFQNFFRMYKKLAGMTGTAMTEADEFGKIYDLDVVSIPTNLPIARADNADLIFMNERGKFKAIIEDIRERQEDGQPVLVGTVAIETSERLARELKKSGIKHEVLNAKQHFREAEIITQAGKIGSVTIATNMAGRGVDILLGGNPEGLAREMLRKEGVDVSEVEPQKWDQVYKEAKAQCDADKQTILELGGLYVLGTERHDARRIDNQLRGRSGRQGDPGESRFYLSMEDELMQRFGGERIRGLMDTLDVPEDMPIENRVLSNSIQQAQMRVEGHNFDIRKRVLEYDDVVNKQREDLYKWRQAILHEDEAALRERYQELIAEVINSMCNDHLDGDPQDWNLEQLHKESLVFRIPSDVTVEKWEHLSAEDIETDLLKGALRAYDGRVEHNGENMHRVEREIFLRTMDELWVRHLTDLSILREGIGLQAIRQRNPLVEYQIEGFQMYNGMKDEIKHEVAKKIYHAEIRQQPQTQFQNVRESGGNSESTSSGGGRSGRSGNVNPNLNRQQRRRQEKLQKKAKKRKAKKA